MSSGLSDFGTYMYVLKYLVYITAFWHCREAKVGICTQIMNSLTEQS